MNAIAYIRKSVHDEESTSYATQRTRIEAYCVAQGWELAGTYEDQGVSGGKRTRPGLTAAMEAITNGEAEALVVLRLDRLTRDLRHLLDIVDELAKLGAEFVSVTDSFDTSSANGRLTLNILASVAQWERDMTSERRRDQAATLRSEGKTWGGTAPFGWTVDEEKYLHEDPAEQRVLGRIRQARQAGTTFSSIARDLNAEGVPTKTGSSWSHTQVARAIRFEGVPA